MLKKTVKKPAVKRTPKATAEGTYIGMTITDDKPAKLYLLPGTFKGPWAKAGEWAKKQGGTLPSRIDGLVLFERGRAKFERDWYWTDTQCAGYDAYAWCQSFNDGFQNGNRKDDEYRARAVRRVPV
jgi:hypothetical protein